MPGDGLPGPTRLWVAALTAVGSTGAGLGYAARHDPMVLLTVFVGIVTLGAAIGLGVGLALGLAEGVRHAIRRALGALEPVEGQGPFSSRRG